MKKVSFILSAFIIILLLPVLVRHASSQENPQKVHIDCLNSPTQNRFKDNGDGTITDHCTDLLWQKSTSNTQENPNPADQITWNTAPTYCSSLNLGKQTGWRVPTIQELFTIVNYNTTNGIYTYPLFDFGDSNETGLYLWSSTPNVDNSVNVGHPAVAWQIQFTNVNSNGGGSVTSSNEADPLEVRCVQSQ